jgi:hypothetical protein
MTIELTHEQATILRAIDLDVWTGHYIGHPCIGSDDFSWAIDDVEVQGLTPAGREALAAYDAKWATVRKDNLQIVIEELSAKIAEHDELYAGYEDQLARMDDARRALTRLREAMKCGS